MVVFLDLEDENEPPEQVRNHWLMQQHENSGLLRSLSLRSQNVEDSGRDNPNKDQAITRMLACYPYVTV
jgi:hypothetical protein